MRVICPNPEDISDSVLEFLRRNFKCYFKKISQKNLIQLRIILKLLYLDLIIK